MKQYGGFVYGVCGQCLGQEVGCGYIINDFKKWLNKQGF